MPNKIIGTISTGIKIVAQQYIFNKIHFNFFISKKITILQSKHIIVNLKHLKLMSSLLF